MSAPRSEALARRLAELADSKQAEEIVVLDMRDLVSYTDFLVICTARNERQARAIVDEVRMRVKEEMGLLPSGADTGVEAGWAVLDYLDCCPPRLHRGGAPALSGSRTSGARRRAWSSTSTPPKRPPSPAPEKPSEGHRTVPRMGSFKRALLGYRRFDVDDAIAAREAQISDSR